MVCILALSLFFRNAGQDALDAANRITTFSCSETLTQKLGETDSEALKEQLAEMLIVEIFEQEQESISIKIVSDYAEAAFCFGTEREVTEKECGIFLEIPGFEYRFYGEDHLVDLGRWLGKR